MGLFRFFREHVWASSGLIIGPIITMGLRVNDAWTLYSLGLPRVAWELIGFGIFFAAVFSLLYQWWSKQQRPQLALVEVAPLAPGTPAQNQSTARTRYYSDFDRDRLAEAMHKLSELLNRQVASVGERVHQVDHFWERNFQDPVMVERVRPLIDQLLADTDEITHALFMGIYRDYQDYSQELRDLTHSDRQVESEQPLNRVNAALGKFSQAVSLYQVALPYPAVQGGIYELARYPRQELSEAGNKLRAWADQCRQRIKEKRESLHR